MFICRSLVLKIVDQVRGWKRKNRPLALDHIQPFSGLLLILPIVLFYFLISNIANICDFALLLCWEQDQTCNLVKDLSWVKYKKRALLCHLYLSLHDQSFPYKGSEDKENKTASIVQNTINSRKSKPIPSKFILLYCNSIGIAF